ncbi:hypothetical protein ES332_A11G381500v1 [Gossypium tomentosum]|uniref:Uncharacterized protein n=1 Tax=Gossypium tomentosum TaxID=34277 RepID=A0A5D2NL09_GOSTO|nr:hypothetical protein ES332_A11G381500v1 [Gossypium tomentosum]
MFGNGSLLLLQITMPYVWPFVELELKKHRKWPFMHVNKVLFSNSFIVAFGTVSLLKHDNCRRYCIWKFIIPLYTELMKSLTNPRGYI